MYTHSLTSDICLCFDAWFRLISVFPPNTQSLTMLHCPVSQRQSGEHCWSLRVHSSVFTGRPLIGQKSSGNWILTPRLFSARHLTVLLLSPCMSAQLPLHCVEEDNFVVSMTFYFTTKCNSHLSNAYTWCTATKTLSFETKILGYNLCFNLLWQYLYIKEQWLQLYIPESRCHCASWADTSCCGRHSTASGGWGEAGLGSSRGVQPCSRNCDISRFFAPHLGHTCCCTAYVGVGASMGIGVYRMSLYTHYKLSENITRLCIT